MSLEALRPLALILSAVLFAFLVGGVVTYRDAATDTWSTCTTRRAGELLHGSICHRRYFVFVSLSFIIATSLGVAFWKSARRISRVMDQPGAHLRVDDETFWCEQLIEPIRFADIIEVRRNRFRSTILSLTFVLNTPPNLAYGKQMSEDTWRGNKPTFTFERLGYLNGAELLDTIASLAEQHRRQ